MRFTLIFSFLFIVNLSCDAGVPLFDEQRAYKNLLEQCEFGPRNPGSVGHMETKKYIINIVEELADTVLLQDFSFNIYGEEESYDGTNIIARYNVFSPVQVLIGAHWDTRPWADKDRNKGNIGKPIIGANDGASGVAILLELARLLKFSPAPIGINIVFFDAEDSGVSGDNESYCKGSIYFSKNLPIKGIKEAIILDMVGDKELSLPIERNSLNFNGQLVRQLWDRAKELGLNAFKGVVGPAIYDDHVPLNQYAGIPAIDIIDFRYPNSFANYWHTMDDIPQNCSAQSLGQVGMLMVDYIYNRKFYSTQK
tara:strand:- start:793 stop:1722 length:930 start_codon:yes stop_codon:yes gene_type:complete